VNKKIAAGVVAGLLAGGVAGVALGMPALSGAQESPSTTAPADQAPSDSATPPAGAPARGQWMQDALAPLVEKGTIDQSQADAVISALEAAKPQRGDGDGMHGGMRGGPGRGLDTAATAIGITADELRTALQGGQTIAEVAQAKGVDPQVVVDAITAELKAHLDEEVASGEHTQEEADQILADAGQRITDMVNGQLPQGGPGMGGPGMGGMGRGHGFGPGDQDDSGSGSTGTSTDA
jgi:hypothetical protein